MSTQKLLMSTALLTVVSTACISLMVGFSPLVQSSKYDNSPGRFAVLGKPPPGGMFPTFRKRPRIFDARPDSRLLVSPHSFDEVAEKSLPTFRPPTVSLLLHELRLWGVESEFEDGNGCRHQYSSEMLDLLTDEAKLFEGSFAVADSAFFIETPYGIRVSVQGKDSELESRGESHYGQYASAFGTASIPSNQEIVTINGVRYTLQQHLNDLALGYRTQYEQEFFAVAMAHYLETPFAWRDESGNLNDFNTLLTTLCSIELGKGSCFGTHVPYAVAAILQADDQNEFLKSEIRREAIQYLLSVTNQLERSQDDDGTWLIWVDNPLPYQYGNECDDRINVTGHHLEWIAIAPQVAQPTFSTIQKAVDGLLLWIKKVPRPERRLFKSQLPLSHATRALALLSGSNLASR